MALQLGALRDALRAADVPDDLASKAAEEAAGYDNRLSGIEREMDRRFNAVDLSFAELRAEMDRRFAVMERRIDALAADARLLRWMVGFVLAFQIALFAKLFIH